MITKAHLKHTAQLRWLQQTTTKNVNKRAIGPLIAHVNHFLKERMFNTKNKSRLSNTYVLLGYHSDHIQSLSIHQLQYLSAQLQCRTFYLIQHVSKCEGTNILLKLCSTFLSILIWYATWHSEKNNGSTFPPHPWVNGVYKGRIFPCMLLCALFMLILICNLTTFRKLDILTQP